MALNVVYNLNQTVQGDGIAIDVLGDRYKISNTGVRTLLSGDDVISITGSDDGTGNLVITADITQGESISSIASGNGIAVTNTGSDYTVSQTKLTANVIFASGYGTIAANTIVGRFTSGGNSGKWGPSAATTLNGALSGGETTVTVTSTAGLTVGDVLSIATGTPENVTIATIPNGTTFTCSAISGAHSNSAAVTMTDGRQTALAYTNASTNTTGGITAAVIVRGVLTDSALTRRGCTISREIALGNDFVLL